ncbi:hypothetical protein EBQ93_04150 [bacterium]|nr:hypothetical protein [bacterium]
MNEYIYFTESELEEIDSEDVEFFNNFNLDKDPLISRVSNKWRINFVGEVETPINRYFSLPKNMTDKKGAVEDIKKVLNNKNFTTSVDGESLLLTNEGNFESNRVYFEKLKSYFLDFITYGFIYPSSPVKVHSNSPIRGAKISVIDTMRNRKRFGTGLTYKTKDVKNSDGWILDDIYYHTLKQMEKSLMVSESDKREIELMYQYLLSEGYNINQLVDGKIISNKTKKEILDFNDTEKVLEKILKNQVGIVHNPIKNTLIEYYTNKQKASANLKVKVILTKKFEIVWQKLLKEALNHSEKFENDERKLFKDKEIIEDFIPSHKLSEYQLKIVEGDSVPEGDDNWIAKRGNRYFHCRKGRLFIPDIFVQLSDGRKFLGDAKYKKDPSDANYDKEFYLYNDAQENQYPMVIFALPESGNIDQTIVPRNGFRRSPKGDGTFRELLIITVSVKDVIDDALNSGSKVLTKSIELIDKYTRKESWRNR